MLITRDDIQRIGDEDTLIHFFEEKLNLPIPEGATLAQIALPLPLPFLGLDESVAEQIIDCQDFSGLSQDNLGNRRPFLIRFKQESGYLELLRQVAKGLYQKNTHPAEFFFICADEYFQPFAFAYFDDFKSETWNTEVLNVCVWTQGNTRINASSEHDLSALFSPKKPSGGQGDGKDPVVDSKSTKDLLIKLQNIGIPLGRHGDILSGVPLLYKDAFVIDEFTREQLIGEDPNSADLIERFPDRPKKWRWELRNIIYIPSSKNKRWSWSGITEELKAEQIFKETYPAVSAHMNFYKDRIKKGTYSVMFYWEFPTCGTLPKLGGAKIIYRTNSISMRAAYDTSHRFATSATHSIPTTDLSLLAILNSKLFNWYAEKEFKSPKYKPLSFTKENMVKAPIAPRTEKQKEALSDLVQQILDNPDSLEVPNIEQEIDALVYELYQLTPTEIALIEEKRYP